MMNQFVLIEVDTGLVYCGLSVVDPSNALCHYKLEGKPHIFSFMVNDEVQIYSADSLAQASLFTARMMTVHKLKLMIVPRDWAVVVHAEICSQLEITGSCDE